MSLRHDPLIAVLASKLKARRQRLRAGRRQVDAEPSGADRDRVATSYHKIGHDGGGDRGAVGRSVRGGLRAPPEEIILDSTPPMILCTATRRAGSSTAITTAIANSRSMSLRPISARRGDEAAPTSTTARGRSMRSSACRGESGRVGLECGSAASGLWLSARSFDDVVRDERRGLSVRSGAQERLVEEIDVEMVQDEEERCADRPSGAPLQGFLLDVPRSIRGSAAAQASIGKAEWTDRSKANPRFVVTTLTKAQAGAPRASTRDV